MGDNFGDLAAMGAFEEFEVLIIMAGKVGRRSQQLQIVGGKRACPIGVRERAVGIGPGPPPKGFASLLQRVVHVRAKMGPTELRHPFAPEQRTIAGLCCIAIHAATGNTSF
jgi:hypothetical protein